MRYILYINAHKNFANFNKCIYSLFNFIRRDVTFQGRQLKLHVSNIEYSDSKGFSANGLDEF